MLKDSGDEREDVRRTVCPCGAPKGGEDEYVATRLAEDIDAQGFKKVVLNGPKEPDQSLGE